MTPKEETPLTADVIMDILWQYTETENRSVGVGCNHESYILPTDFKNISRKVILTVQEYAQSLREGDIESEAEKLLKEYWGMLTVAKVESNKELFRRWYNKLKQYFEREDKASKNVPPLSTFGGDKY